MYLCSQVLCRQHHWHPIWKMVLLSGSRNPAGANNQGVRHLFIFTSHTQIMQVCWLDCILLSGSWHPSSAKRENLIQVSCSEEIVSPYKLWAGVIVYYWMDRWSLQGTSFPAEHHERDDALLLQRLAGKTETVFGEWQAHRHVRSSVWDWGKKPSIR